MTPYMKPLRGGGSRIIHRGAGGRFARPTLGADVCGHCSAFILPETVDVGSERFPMLKKQWPTSCHRCGKSWRTQEGAE